MSKPENSEENPPVLLPNERMADFLPGPTKYKVDLEFEHHYVGGVHDEYIVLRSSTISEYEGQKSIALSYDGVEKLADFARRAKKMFCRNKAEREKMIVEEFERELKKMRSGR